MRGDTLRDFYAKSVALLGLGLLGAVGAAVDYWPSDLAAPATVALDLRAPSPGALPKRALASEPVRVVTSRASVVVAGAAPAPVSLVQVSSRTVTPPQPESAPAPDLPPLVPAAFTGAATLVATEVDLSPLDLSRPTFHGTTVAPLEVVNTRHQNVFAEIGSGIAGGTAKVGSAFAGGIQKVGGAVGGAMVTVFKGFGHLNPFKSRAFTVPN